MLISRHWRIQLLQDDLHTALAMHKAPDVMHHGGVTEHARALVRRPVTKSKVLALTIKLKSNVS